MTDLEGKVAIVTGGASGLGRATAEAMAAAGASVIVADVDEDGGHETVDGIERSGGAATFAVCDVTDEGSVRSMVDLAVSTYGGLDLAYNNSGIEGHHAATVEQTEDEFRRVLDVNLMGVFYCMKHEIPKMLERGGGVIVNTSSTAGLRGYRNLMPYVASKHAVAGMTKTAALEYADQGIRVLSLHPAAIATPMVERVMAEDPEMAESMTSMHPIGRVGEPREIADVVVFLCSDGASFMTGTQVVVDGGALSHG
ncbi:MAG TPA: glucose 1-dehydrogenase [Acidimicrobiales bacterium]|nr:glucose 1-dehydrogenase [Acidimicrobiales bacterium]